jgi:uncharacterized membrane protein YgaE (UPF0421/DUF939 family)
MRHRPAGPAVSARGTGSGALLDRAASWLAPRLRATVTRLRHSLWPITQTAVAAGLSYYIAHTLIGHGQPFFAPIAATVSMGTSSDLRGQRAAQLVFGTALGIAIGVGIEALLGTGPVALGVAVFLALNVALAVGYGFFARGMMFSNQMANAAILVIALHSRTAGWDRLFDALIGGGVALIFSLLLFPPRPQPGIRRAAESVFTVSAQELRRLRAFMASRGAINRTGPPASSGHIGRALDGLDLARASAREIVRLAPRRRSRTAATHADELAAYIAGATSAVLALGSLVMAAIDAGEPLPPDLQQSIRELSAGLAGSAGENRGVSATEAEAKAAQAVHSAGHAVSGPVALIPVIASMATLCDRMVIDISRTRL